MRSLVGTLAVSSLLIFGVPGVKRPPPVQQPLGHVLQPDEGLKLIFCSAPGLSVTIKVDSVSGGATRLAMGTAEIAPRASNVGIHRDEDEIIYFSGGRGRAILGTDTVAVDPGATMYVPHGVRHGFMNGGDAPLQFVWVDVPGALASKFRAAGQSSEKPCGRGS